jgi:hypothetical protein
MENIVLQMTVDSILSEANAVFGDLLNGAMNMVGKITETIGSVTSGL